MRLVLVLVLAGLVVPLSASAQDAAESATPEASAEEPVTEKPTPSAEPAPEEPALQLKLDAAGVGVTPSPSRTEDGYTLEEMDLRVRRAGIGLGFSGAVLVSGGVMLGIGAADADTLRWRLPGAFGGRRDSDDWRPRRDDHHGSHVGRTQARPGQV